ncbi:uncharacterized protein V1516DRAFT_697201 [Lipomyces oligophaga]|uniref:uncharacterized protein n=1 Tax=Lipomyces oligophaga TaxID=45792 RepID=UPI0034CF9F7B
MIQSQSQSSAAFLEASRSPPSKNLSHVPCKFFRQGTCQAGATCPFSHSMDSQLEQAPCKYFQKGNCKFGAKCALAHILPDGRRVNHRSLPQPFVQPGLQLGARNILPDISTNAYANSPSGLGRSLQQNRSQAPSSSGSGLQHQHQQHSLPLSQQLQQQTAQTLQSVHSSQTKQPNQTKDESNDYFPKANGKPSNLSSAFSSHNADNSTPPDLYSTSSTSQQRPLAALDTPFPASLESNEISFLAHRGPIASSVPAKFGLEIASPSTSVPQQMGMNNSSSNALRSLYASAYGADSGPSSFKSISGSGPIGSKPAFGHHADDAFSSSASSPSGLSLAAGASQRSQQYIGQQQPQQSAQQQQQQNGRYLNGRAPNGTNINGQSRRAISTSFPAQSTIWRSPGELDDMNSLLATSAHGTMSTSSLSTMNETFYDQDEQFEEEFVPSSLNELLTPFERHRRGSRHDENFNSGDMASSLRNGAIGESLHSSSPRNNGIVISESPRFGQLFGAQFSQGQSIGSIGSVMSSSFREGSSAVAGSPLRYASAFGSNEAGALSSSPVGANRPSLSSERRNISSGPPVLQRTPSGRFPEGVATTTESGLGVGLKSESSTASGAGDEEDETQFLMDEEQVDVSIPSSVSKSSQADGLSSGSIVSTNGMSLTGASGRSGRNGDKGHDGNTSAKISQVQETLSELSF